MTRRTWATASRNVMGRAFFAAASLSDMATLAFSITAAMTRFMVQKPWQPAIRDATAGARRRAGLGTPRRRTQHHATARTSDKTETSKGSVQLTSCRAGSVRRDNRGVMFGEKVARGGISDPSLRSPDFQFWHRPSGRGSARHYSTANGGDSLGSWLPSVWGQRDSLP